MNSLLYIALGAWVIVNQIRPRSAHPARLLLVPAILIALACFQPGGLPTPVSSFGKSFLLKAALFAFLGLWRGANVRVWRTAGGAPLRRGTAASGFAWLLSLVAALGAGVGSYFWFGQDSALPPLQEGLLLGGLTLLAEAVMVLMRARRLLAGQASGPRRHDVWITAGAVAVIFLGGAWAMRPGSYPRLYRRGSAAAALSAAPALAALGKARHLYVGAAVDLPGTYSWADAQGAVGRDFNSVKPERALKWGSLLKGGILGGDGVGQYDFSQVDRLVAFATSRGSRVRGHNLLWGRYSGEGYPADLADFVMRAGDPAARMRQVLAAHILRTVGHFRGQIPCWDVVNEPLDLIQPRLDPNLFFRAMGPNYIATAFELARRADPAAELFLNEQLDDYDTPRAAFLLALLKDLVEQHVPIDAVGLESHILLHRPDLAAARAFAEQVARLGLRCEITELDVRLGLFAHEPDPYAAQGRFVTDYVRAFAAVRGFQGVTLWGVSDRDSWLDRQPPFAWLRPNNALLLDEDQCRKPAYAGLARALIFPPST